MNNSIFVVNHRNTDCYCDSLYKKIYVGKKDFEISDGYRDDVGDNISDKNEHYCELTAQYWVWKNIKTDNGFVGFCHYRRFFTKNRFSNKSKYFLSYNDVYEILKSYDVILPMKFKWKRISVKEYYTLKGAGKENDLLLIGEIIEKKYPEYYSEYCEVLNGNEASYCNMFIMKADSFKNYMCWLFSILDEFDKKIDYKDYNKAETRVDGYLSEILLNVWVSINCKHISYQYAVKTDDSLLDKIGLEFRLYNKYNALYPMYVFVHKLLKRIRVINRKLYG